MATSSNPQEPFCCKSILLMNDCSKEHGLKKASFSKLLKKTYRPNLRIKAVVCSLDKKSLLIDKPNVTGI